MIFSPPRAALPTLVGILGSALLVGCASASGPEGTPEYDQPQRWSQGVELDSDLSGDLRPEAREVIRLRDEGVEVDPRGPVSAAWQPPATIRVWRRGLDGSTASCRGRVDVIPLERYVKGVLPHEWIRSWHAESLRAGAIAIRTYAASWITSGGKYTCADLDDTTASQVYKDATFAVTNDAVDATAGMFAMKNGAPVFAEYSAENSNPTATGISDPLCAGQTRFGHGRGACQWGTQRWANSGKAHKWIIEHYYPGAVVTRVGGVPDNAIVVDSNPTANDAAFAKVEYTGMWTSTSATAGFHGTDYRWAETAQASAPATFSFFLPAAASKSIDAWWVAGSNRSATAMYIVYAASGAELGRVTVDQRAAGSQWNALGTFAFGAGWNKVVLSRWQAPGAVVVADAIRVR